MSILQTLRVFLTFVGHAVSSTRRKITDSLIFFDFCVLIPIKTKSKYVKIKILK